MFVGHFAVAMAAKRAAPRTSLGILVLAAQLLDLLWPLLLIVGLERVEIRHDDTAFTPLLFSHYPYSHSLAAAALWAVLLGGAYFGWRRDGRGAVVIAALVLSHWVLDWITHRPDLPLYPGGERVVGLGLWNSVAGTLVVELAMFASGIVVYLRATRGTPPWNLAAYAAVLLAVYLAAAFGPPPPSVEALAATTFGLWLLVAWAWAVDRRRVPAIA